MPFLLSNNTDNKKRKINTSPTKSEIEAAKNIDIDLGKSWRAYSKEARIHIYVSDMVEMVKFYNKILEFPVVRYWRSTAGDGTMIDIGGNIIELFSKNKKNYSNKNYFGNISLSMRVNDVEKTYKKFCSKNIEISELESNEWGDSSFHVIDPEKNRLVFFSPQISKEKYYKVKRS
jgi:uncharacterized glyoxalase superfamily protein PhnB